MNNYFTCYDEFATASFEILDQFVLILYQKALESGLTGYEAKHAVETFLSNRMNRSYIEQLVDQAARCSFDYPGVSRDDIHV